MLETLITSKTRLRILIKFFINVTTNGHLRGLATEMQESTNAIRKELNNLSDAGYLDKFNEKNRVSYKANSKHPLFLTLQKIIHQHIGLEAIVSSILERLGSIKTIIVVGDYANGIDSGVIEVVLVGDDLDKDYINRLAYKIKSKIDREVHFIAKNSYEGVGLILFQI
jgi:hypothetical protein